MALQTNLPIEPGRKITSARLRGVELVDDGEWTNMGALNGTAARKATAAPPAQWEPPKELHARSWTEEHARSVFHARKWRTQGGLARQSVYAIIDIALVCGNALIIFGIRFGFTNMLTAVVAPKQVIGHISVQAYPSFLILYCSLIFLGCVSQRLYRTPREVSTLVESARVAKAVGIATALLVLFIFSSGNREISRLVVVLTGAANIVALSGWRYAKRRLVLHRAENGQGQSRALVVGAGEMGQAFASWLQHNRHLGYDFCGFLDPHPNGDKRVLGGVSDLRKVALAQFVDEVFVTIPADGPMIKQLFLEARDLRLDLHVLPDLYDGLAWRAPLHMIGGFPILELHREPIPTTGLAIKRVIDILASLAGLVLALPLLVVAGIWIRLDSAGPAIYGAPRVGKKGNKFTCYKLRTMVASADKEKEQLRKENERNGPFFKMEDDPRVTRCGRWLRKFSLDELPQLVNVLKGEMSLVGPRPHPVDDYEQYTLEHLRRLDVKPGMTGLWQVTARRDPSFETNMKLDLEYIENWSLGLDAEILAKTLPAVLRAEGI
ncbi:MAG TPA: sugar transferase [Candidatus Baltobacteraceae bacterium]|nr:sugar transferase [Candidatus Baltobacteraceae bacterium]